MSSPGAAALVQDTAATVTGDSGVAADGGSINGEGRVVRRVGNVCDTAATIAGVCGNDAAVNGERALVQNGTAKSRQAVRDGQVRNCDRLACVNRKDPVRICSAFALHRDALAGRSECSDLGVPAKG